MTMEGYQDNKKIKDGKSTHLELPLNIKEGKLHGQGGESSVVEVQTQNQQGQDQAHIVLKINQKEVFATDAEMQESKKFYEFLKNFPDFGKFVPETLFFKARETAEDNPKAFCIQKFAKGERIDRLEDSEIYKNPEIVKQLIELSDASIRLLQTVKAEGLHNPDFMRTPEMSNARVLFGAMVLNPRYSSNILIADEPDKNGRRVFFIDVGPNANARMKKGWEWSRRNQINSLTTFHFTRWKKELEDILAKQK